MISPGLKNEAEDCLAGWGLRVGAQIWPLLDKYMMDVLEYNRKVNITAARETDSILRRHVLDGMAAVAPLRARLDSDSPRLLDVGAGAGFIGFGVKLGWPGADVTLMESSYRKYCFLNLASAHLGLRGLRVLQERAGPGTDGGYDAVLSRALAPLPQAVRLCLPLARPGGLALIYQSEAPAASNPSLCKALRSAGGGWEDTVTYRLPGETQDRHLAAFRRES